jgi:protein gp37
MWRKPRTIFVNSMSDLFHEGVSEEFIRAVWDVMCETPRHTYQILTKRPERMAAIVPGLGKRPLPNVWLGTTVEDSAARPRMEFLRAVPAAVRFISFVPLIGPVDPLDLSGIHWAIVGGESGPRARPLREEWITGIYEQCRKDNVAFFFKQWGAWGRDNKRRSKKVNGREYRGRMWDERPVLSQ